MEIPGDMRVLNTADTIVTLTAFNYDLQFDPVNQMVMIGIQMAGSKTRYMLPFGRLEFGQFLRALTGAWDNIRENTDGDIPSIIH